MYKLNKMTSLWCSGTECMKAVRSISTRGAIKYFLFPSSGNKTKRDVELRHATLEKFGKK